MVATTTLMVTLAGSQVWARAADPNPGASTITGNIDFLNRSMFIAGIVTVPFGGTTHVGAWNVHFGGEGSQFIGSVGVRLSY
jgi:hypothetical protein